MEKELNLVELLKDTPKGTKLYSPICGECELENVENSIINMQTCVGRMYFHSNGTYYRNCGECLLFPSRDNRDWSTFKVEKEGFKVGDYIKEKDSDNVFKIKEQDESFVTLIKVLADSSETERWISVDILDRYEKVSKFDPKWLKPFDRVLMRNCYDDNWFASFFSNLIDDKYEDRYVAIDGWCYKSCIPYNEETKHLVGTTDDEPTFYKID